MILEHQVVSRELAKILKDFGVKQDSLFWWAEGGPLYRGEMPFFLETNYSAFTVAELGDLIPERVDEYRKNYIKFQKVRCEITQKNHYLCSFVEDGGYNMDYVEFDCSDENEANSRAKMLIFLIKNNYLKEKDDK